jgi:hypothetical protein
VSTRGGLSRGTRPTLCLGRLLVHVRWTALDAVERIGSDLSQCQSTRMSMAWSAVRLEPSHYGLALGQFQHFVSRFATHPTGCAVISGRTRHGQQRHCWYIAPLDGNGLAAIRNSRLGLESTYRIDTTVLVSSHDAARSRLGSQCTVGDN